MPTRKDKMQQVTQGKDQEVGGDREQLPASNQVEPGSWQHRLLRSADHAPCREQARKKKLSL